jgi:hypothetical protein
MKKNHTTRLPVFCLVLYSILQTVALSGFSQGPGPRPPLPPIPINGDTTHSLTRHFALAGTAKTKTNANGFIQRWLVLEPVRKEIARNNVFTDSYVRTAFATDNFSSDYNAVPKNGETVKLGNQELKWYALDSKTFNFNLYNFLYAIDKPKYGVLFWLVTVVNCTEDIKDVRLAAGCNSSSMWWVNGQEALLLSGDRDLIADNGTSARITLKKGKNIIRGAVMNGPGMANFCARFIDEKGVPVKNLQISTE